MKLTVREAAALLGETEDRVHDWIEDRNLPAQRIRGQFRINRSELLEWATENHVAISAGAFAAADDESAPPSIAGALRAGGIHRGVPGENVVEVLCEVVRLLPMVSEAERETLTEFVRAREASGSTAVGHGIAIPHVRSPIVLAPAEVVASLCFLDRPLDLGARDSKPVDTLFFLVCPTIKAHLATLARLAHLLRNGDFRNLLERRAPDPEILDIVVALEGTL